MGSNKPKEEMEYFRGETVHDYIGVLVEMIMKIDSMEIGNLDKDRIRVLLSDSIYILNEY